MWILSNTHSKFPNDNTTKKYSSPVLYTAFDGYAYKLELTFTQTHMGIFYYLHPGFNDDNLEWPFFMKVSIGLMIEGSWLDEIYGRALDPKNRDFTRESWQQCGRPTEGNTKGVGWEKFYSKKKMEDKIYILVKSRKYDAEI